MIIREHMTETIRSGKDIGNLCRAILAMENEIDQDKEHFWTMGLDTKNCVKYIELVSLGGLSLNIVHPRETFRLAIMKGVASIIVAHNHPSGNPSPSQEDLALTKRLQEAGGILGIQVLDHVIVGIDSQWSITGGGLTP